MVYPATVKNMALMPALSSNCQMCMYCECKHCRKIQYGFKESEK